MITKTNKIFHLKCNVCARKMFLRSGLDRAQELKHDLTRKDNLGNCYHEYMCPYSHIELINVEEFK